MQNFCVLVHIPIQLEYKGGYFMFVVNGKNSIIRFIAGFFVLSSVILSQVFHPYWLFFTGFVGFMLMFSSLTGFCPMEIILKSLGVKEKVVCDIENKTGKKIK